jgi:NADH-quinone oxidoreductase subunit A
MYMPIYFEQLNYNLLPTFYLDCYLVILVLILTTVMVSIIIVSIINLFGTRFWFDTSMHSVYECGFLPLAEAHIQFESKFYMIALSFIIFDLETCFFFPWFLTFMYQNIYAYIFFFIFFFSVIMGLVYEWRIGLLDWK